MVNARKDYDDLDNDEAAAACEKIRRVRALVVCRESAAYDYVLFEGMVDQTIRGLPKDLAGIYDVLAAGVEPVRGKGPFKVTVLTRDGTQAVLFEHKGIYYLYSLGSAAKTVREKEENAFVEILCEVLTSLQPRDVYAATFSRLLRSTEFSGRLEKVFRRTTDTLHCGPSAIELNTPSGKIMWQTMAMIADMERDAIVQRLFAGLVSKYHKGSWVLNAEAVPPGYRLVEGQVVLDHDHVDGVRALLRLMADPDLNARAVVNEAGRLGVSTKTIQRVHGEGATFANLRRADSRLRSLIDWLPTYETGQVTVTHPVPYEGAETIGGLPVRGSGEAAYVEFAYQWPVPEGGWGPPEVLTAVAAARGAGRKEQRCSGKPKGVRRRKPLVGFEWANPLHVFRISSQQNLYRIMRQDRDAESEGSPQ